MANKNQKTEEDTGGKKSVEPAISLAEVEGISDLVDAFDRLCVPISELVGYMRRSEEMVRSTGRFMKIQTVLAMVVLLGLLAMAWVVGGAWSDMASTQAMLAETNKMVAHMQEKSAATYDYLVQKFPEDLAEISIVEAQPATAQVVFKSVEPIPDPDGVRKANGIERREKMLKKALKMMAKERRRGGSAIQRAVDPMHPIWHEDQQKDKQEEVDREQSEEDEP